MPYAILRFEKRKSGAIGGLNKHHERQKKKYDSNPDIDLRRSHQNYSIVKPQAQYRDEIFRRINDAGCKVRKDSVLFIDTLITASPEFFEQRSSDDARQYFERAVEFLDQEVGRDNIISAVVHMDERNPHLHLCFTPITKDKQLSAKEIIGNRNALVAWQDRFHEHMSAAFPELERGEPAIETKRKHMPTRIYKQAVRLTEEMAQIKTAISSIGTFNAQKKKEEILQKLNTWMPLYNSFQDQLKPYKRQIQETEEYNRSLRAQLDRQAWDVQGHKVRADDLQQQLWEYREFIDSIPEELRAELQQRFDQMQEQEQELEQTFYE